MAPNLTTTNVLLGMHWIVDALRHWRVMVLLLGAALLPSTVFPARTLAAGVVNEHAILRVEIVRSRGTSGGTCFLVHRERRTNDVVLYFATAAHLFKTSEGESRGVTRHVRVLPSGEPPVEISEDDIFLPRGDMLDVAVIRAAVPTTTFVPLLITFEPPRVDATFVISGYHGDGSRATLPQRVRFESTLVIVGDRIASELVGCAGAPALVEDGVFGVVSECQANRNPIVVPLTAARSFIERTVPGLKAKSTDSPRFEVVVRPIPED